MTKIAVVNCDSDQMTLPVKRVAPILKKADEIEDVIAG